MNGTEELLSSGGPGLPRWARRAVLVVAVVGLVVAAAVWLGAGGTPSRSSRAPTSSPVPQSSAPVAGATPGPWPTASGACGSDPELPIVSSTRPRTPTGLTLLVGSDALRAVDFDTGTALVTERLRPGDYIWSIAAGGYALTTRCHPGVQRLIRPNGPADVVDGQVMVDGERAYDVVSPDDTHPRGSLTLLDGGMTVDLPRDFAPLAITSGVVVGLLSNGAVVGLVDARTGAVRARLGEGSVLAAGSGAVFWTTGCDISVARPCVLHRRDVRGGSVRSYALPRAPGFALGAVSADGSSLAFPLQRATLDPRFDAGHPLPPTDVAVLDVRTGVVRVVPGVELPAKTAPALLYSADGRWLVIGLDAGTRTRLLAWRPGLTRPYETHPVPGLVFGTPPAIGLAT